MVVVTIKNYICINGENTEITEEQLTEIEKIINTKLIRLKSIPTGETFKIQNYEFIVLEHSEETTAVILKDLIFENNQFGKNNNYKCSEVDYICNSFGSEIEKIVDKRNVIEHTVDLTSDDGLKDYGKVRRYSSLLTTELYRRYVEILDKYKVKNVWWLATPLSTLSHKHNEGVKCVSPHGSINSCYCDSVCGIRPFCVLNSDVVVRKK